MLPRSIFDSYPRKRRKIKPKRASLGAEMWHLRKLAGISGAEMATCLNVSQSRVSRYERGQSLPTLAILTTWTDLCGMPERLAGLTKLLEAAVNDRR